MKKVLTACTCLLFFIIGCKKDNVNNTIPVKIEDLVGTYTLMAMKVSASGGSEQDEIPLMNECEKDDLYILNPENSFQYVDAGKICEPNGNYMGTWQLDGNLISFYGETGTITKFDGGILEVTSTSKVSGTTYTRKSTFRKQ
jgi:hypothetical protein